MNRKDKKRKEANLRQRLSPLSESVKTAEDAIARLRQERSQLESAMADNELYRESQNSRLMELLRQKSELDRALDDAEEAWVQASEDLESALDNENL